MPPEHYPELHIEPKPKKKFGFIILLILIAGLVIGSFSVIGKAPSDFIPGTVVIIPESASVKTAAAILERNNIIRSSSTFSFLLEIVRHNKPIIAGEFQFDESQDVLEVINRLTKGVFGNAQIKITIPEGSSNKEIGLIIKKAIPGWDVDQFIAKAKPDEGYLFPETYYLFKTATPDLIINQLKKEYAKKTKIVTDDILASQKSESEIIIMASLLEKEAYTSEEARIISGILWKRIEKGMPLQVDAPFLYVLNKTSKQLTLQDLQKDGPYNTYTRKGLPVGPIGNPGIEMIKAALFPSTSPYFYYLHDAKGTIYYGKTYEEHLANKRKYLK